jgi:hypothetical protein
MAGKLNSIEDRSANTAKEKAEPLIPLSRLSKLLQHDYE